MAYKKRRLEPLDALRGFAAIGLAVGAWLAIGDFGEVRFIGNLQLLADFILVIAGFIVARAHREQLTQTRKVKRYLFARFGRHFPLHAGCLSIFLAVDAASRHFGGAPISGDALEFLSSLALLHLAFEGAYAWNAAAWIVAAELWMSFFFALLCVVGGFSTHGRTFALFAAVVAMTGVRIAFADALPHAADLGLRAAAAFLTGALLQAFVAHRGVTIAIRKLKKRAGTTLELWGASSIATFLLLAPPEMAPAAPLIFGQCLLIFLRMKCGVSSFLDKPWPQKAGELSYAIVLSHLLVVAPLANLGASPSAQELTAVATFGAPMYVVLVLLLAETAHRIFDVPTRGAMHEWAQRVFPERPEYNYDEGADDAAPRLDATPAEIAASATGTAGVAAAAEALISETAASRDEDPAETPPKEPPLPLPAR